jgi:peptidoglycan/xylan/chitin deacetylase (PgdA/CDA1 family)
MSVDNIDPQILGLALRMARGEYVWTLHYHNTPAVRGADYRRQIAAAARKFRTLDQRSLVTLMRTGIWTDDRPGLMIACFDGYRNNNDVLLPLLDEFNLTGWFFIVTDFIDLGCQATPADLDRLRLEWLPGEYADGRFGMSWQEIHSLQARHTIVNHSASHYPLTPQPEATYLEASVLQHEVLESTTRFKTNGIDDCTAFTWLFGCAAAEHPAAARILTELGYQLQIGSRGIDLLPEALRNSSAMDLADDPLVDLLIEKAMIPGAKTAAFEASADTALVTCQKREPAISGIPSMLSIPALCPPRAVKDEQLVLAGDFIRWSRFMADRTGLTGRNLADKSLGCYCQYLFDRTVEA